MPSPATDPDNPSALIGENEQTTMAAPTDPAQVKSARRRRLWLWTLVGLAVGLPLLLTLAGALTSPPHVKSIPVGHLIFLEADEPSDHTSLLRGLRIMGRDGSSRQLLHETEPQDTDSGSREWITQPQASPDGKWLAYEKQNITLQEEKQAIDNQLWVLPLGSPHPQPRLLLDLTKRELKQFVGLAWTADSRSVVFLNDATAYYVPVDGNGHVVPHSLGRMPGLALTKDMSSTRSPSLSANSETVYRGTTSGTLYAVSRDGKETASLPTRNSTSIKIADDAPSQGLRLFAARWGWSVYGRRHITELKWSPDGKYLAYSVSKPPFEDELFYIDVATGKCCQLPVRTGSAGWDWSP